jgi:hypothetical protein
MLGLLKVFKKDRLERMGADAVIFFNLLNERSNLSTESFQRRG